MIYSKFVPIPLGVLKQVFLACFEPMVAHVNPSKTPINLENGLFGEQKWVQNKSKPCFCENCRSLFGLHKQAKCAHFEPIVSDFGTSKITKCIENGLFWDQNTVKNGSKMHFCNNDPRALRLPKQVK